MGDTWHIRPTEADLKAAAQLQAAHPNLTTTADVLRYALHMITTYELGADYLGIAPPTDDQRRALRARIGIRYKAYKNKDAKEK